jgi:hypothetical protein
MGRRNISYNLKDRIARVMGERETVTAKIERIEALVEELPAIRARADHLAKLIDSIEILLTDIDPTWSRDEVIPIKPYGFRSPIPFGEGRRLALEVLKSATKKMTSREITDALLHREAVFDLDVPTWERVRTNVDEALRRWENKFVKRDNRRPCRWWAVTNPSTNIPQ